MNSYNIPNESRPSTDSCRWTVDDLQVHVVLPKHHTMSTFDTFQLQCLKKMYSSLYCIQEEDVIINSAYQKYVFATLNGKVLGRYKSRSKSSSIVIASWNPQMFCHNYPEEYDSCFERPVRIEFFAQHTVTLQTKAHTHLLFSALWFKPHPKKDFYGKPLTVWEPDIYELSGVNSLIPVQFIRKRTASLVDRIDCSGSVLFVCPLIHF